MPHRANDTNQSISPSQYHAQALLERLEVAFGTLSPPAPEEVFRNHFECENHPDRERVQDYLSQHHWRELSQRFLDEFWSWYSYLTAPGYRHMVAGLLWHCLQSLQRDNSLLHATVYMVLRHPDRELTRTALLSDEQVDVIRHFLGLCMSEEAGRAWSACLSLRRWGAPGHPAFERGAAFDRANRTYTYPPLSAAILFGEEDADESRLDEDDRQELAQRRALLAQVQAAFAHTPRPTGDLTSMCYEGYKYHQEFQSVQWPSAHPRFLNYHYAALSFFTKEAFRYFLPAYLTCDLYGMADSFDLEFHLTYEFYRVRYSIDMTEKLSVFNTQERAAIHAYLHMRGVKPDILAWWSNPVETESP